MDIKITTLLEVGKNVEECETYYLDNNTGEKWIKEYPHSQMHSGGPAQLRKVQQFPSPE